MAQKLARMTLETLHPAIAKSEAGVGRKVVKVIDPSPGLFGGKPIDGLVGIEYECNGECGMKLAPNPHTHGALYGPHIIQWADDCAICLKSKWKKHDGHEYSPIGEEKVEMGTYELYAD